MEEKWKIIKDFPNYQISSFGNVKRLRKEEWEDYPITYSETDGYATIYLSYNKKWKKEYVHRLVGQAFIPNPKPSEYTMVLHIDGIGHHNTVENLYWGNQQINMKARKARGNYQSTDTERKTYTKLTPSDVVTVVKLYKSGISQSEIARLYNVLPCTIGSIIWKRTWKHLNLEI